MINWNVAHARNDIETKNSYIISWINCIQVMSRIFNFFYFMFHMNHLQSANQVMDFIFSSETSPWKFWRALTSANVLHAICLTISSSNHMIDSILKLDNFQHWTSASIHSQHKVCCVDQNALEAFPSGMDHHNSFIFSMMLLISLLFMYRKQRVELSSLTPIVFLNIFSLLFLHTWSKSKRQF